MSVASEGAQRHDPVGGPRAAHPDRAAGRPADEPRRDRGTARPGAVDRPRDHPHAARARHGPAGARLARYRLGPATLRLGNVYLDTLELRSRVASWAEDLARRTGCAVRTGVLLLGDVVVVHHEPRPDGTRQMPEVGIVIPAHACALGKALLAFGPRTPSDARGSSPAEHDRRDHHRAGRPCRAARRGAHNRYRAGGRGGRAR